MNMSISNLLNMMTAKVAKATAAPTNEEFGASEFQENLKLAQNQKQLSEHLTTVERTGQEAPITGSNILDIKPDLSNSKDSNDSSDQPAFEFETTALNIFLEKINQLDSPALDLESDLLAQELSASLLQVGQFKASLIELGQASVSADQGIVAMLSAVPISPEFSLLENRSEFTSISSSLSQDGFDLNTPKGDPSEFAIQADTKALVQPQGLAKPISTEIEPNQITSTKESRVDTIQPKVEISGNASQNKNSGQELDVQMLRDLNVTKLEVKATPALKAEAEVTPKVLTQAVISMPEVLSPLSIATQTLAEFKNQFTIKNNSAEGNQTEVTTPNPAFGFASIPTQVANVGVQKQVLTNASDGADLETEDENSSEFSANLGDFELKSGDKLSKAERVISAEGARENTSEANDQAAGEDVVNVPAKSTKVDNSPVARADRVVDTATISTTLIDSIEGKIKPTQEIEETAKNDSLNLGVRSEFSVSNEVKSEALSHAKPALSDLQKQVLKQIDAHLDKMSVLRNPNMTIQLRPVELGSITINIRQTGMKTEVDISASHHQVAQALEATKADLIQATAARGLDLGSVNVGQQSSDNQNHNSSQQHAQRDDFNRAVNMRIAAQVSQPVALEPTEVLPRRLSSKGLDINL